MLLLTQQYSPNVPESAYEFHHSEPTWMTDRDRQSGDGTGGGCNISFPFLFLCQTTPFKLHHLCKLMASTRCNIH